MVGWCRLCLFVAALVGLPGRGGGAPVEPMALEKHAGRIHLIIQYYDGTYLEHLAELNQALMYNSARDSGIDVIHVLAEKPDLKLPENVTTEKIRIVNIGKRMSFKDAFAYAEEHIRDEVAIIANADIYFDAEVSHLSHRNWKNHKLLLALSRYEVLPGGVIANRECGEDNPLADRTRFYQSNDRDSGYRGSHDAFIFQPPLFDGLSSTMKAAMLDKLDVPLGTIGCETRLLYELDMLQHNITFENPCNYVRIYHLHGATPHEYGGRLDAHRMDLQGKRLWVWPNGKVGSPVFPEEELPVSQIPCKGGSKRLPNGSCFNPDEKKLDTSTDNSVGLSSRVTAMNPSPMTQQESVPEVTPQASAAPITWKKFEWPSTTTEATTTEAATTTTAAAVTTTTAAAVASVLPVATDPRFNLGESKVAFKEQVTPPKEQTAPKEQPAKQATADLSKATAPWMDATLVPQQAFHWPGTKQDAHPTEAPAAVAATPASPAAPAAHVPKTGIWRAKPPATGHTSGHSSGASGHVQSPPLQPQPGPHDEAGGQQEETTDSAQAPPGPAGLMRAVQPWPWVPGKKVGH